MSVIFETHSLKGGRHSKKPVAISEEALLVATFNFSTLRIDDKLADALDKDLAMGSYQL